LPIIYYAGPRNLKVIPASEEPIGIPVTARVPGLNLIIDVCNSDKERHIKELICKINRIKYVYMPEKLPEIDVISTIRKVFAESHVYFASPPDEDLEKIRKNYIRWRNE
jgi:hypothetical protein